MRRFETTHKRSEISVSLYTSQERDAERIGDFELIYENDRLVRIIFAPSWETKNCIVIDNAKRLKWLGQLGSLIEELFSVTGLKGFGE